MLSKLIKQTTARPALGRAMSTFLPDSLARIGVNSFSEDVMEVRCVEPGLPPCRPFSSLSQGGN